MEDTTIRLNKRVAELAACSRREAEAYIEGGWVSVDGALAEDPALRVRPEQQVLVQPGARPESLPPVTIVLHKPAGVAASDHLLTAQAMAGGGRFLRRHLHRQELVAPLAAQASGLVVFTQDFRVARKLREDSPEQEYQVEVAARGGDEVLTALNRQFKASWQSERRLRIAGKRLSAEQIAAQCAAQGLQVLSVHRLRVGRIPLAGLAAGHWRYLDDSERF